jgi:LacI family transcriptional regulator, galactose operon repressor
MPTIKDVARAAGVSITTVSHVINDTRFVSDELRERVQAAMEELGYRPNILARSLRRGETKTIGLVVPDNSNPFFAEMARTVEDLGFATGYSVILCNSDDNLAKEAAYLEVLITKQVDGVVFIASGSSQEHLVELSQQGIPYVVVDREIDGAWADIVLVNNELGGYVATRHLIELGHRRIACITGPSQLTPSADRVRGYRRALREFQIAEDEELVVPGDFRAQGGEAALERLLAVSPPPSAVLACNDMMAIGVLRAARKAGLHVPDDLSVVGFDDIPLASAVSPALTTVAQPITELASHSVQILLARMQNSEEGQPRQRIVLDPRLIVRDSSGSC